jgi:OPA family glycerol-3-phosphate transporter-like MFS transporter
MLPSAAIHRSGWQDLFVARELDYVPYGVDRYFMLVIKALAALMGGLAIALGPVAPLILGSQQLSPPEYGRIVGGVGIAGVIVGLSAGQLGDRFSRVRVLLWGMLPALAFHFLMAFMPNGQPGLFALLYLGLGLTEAWAIVTVSALLRDFSPRTGRALAVGLVTVGTIGANWASTFLAGVFLNQLGTWQRMFLLYGVISLAIWIVLVLFARETSPAIRAQVVHSMEERTAVEQRAVELERSGVKVRGFWSFVTADWRLWALGLAQGLFLFGYTAFVAYGPLFTVQAFHQPPQEASLITSSIYASVIVFLLISGLLCDRLRLRKLPAVVFSLLTGLAYIGLGYTAGLPLTTYQIIVAYVIVGAIAATMWSPTNALFSETAEDIAATRQTTAFAGQRVIYSIITQVWVFIAPSLLADHGWQLVWTICGIGALAAAPVIAFCRGSWGPFPTREPAPAPVPEISRPALA